MPEDFAGGDIEVWPENWPVFELFMRMETQWRVGAAGPTGLDDNVLLKRLDRMNLSADDYAQMDSDIHTMELAALAAMNEKSD